jgi:hypothetical protein
MRKSSYVKANPTSVYNRNNFVAFGATKKEMDRALAKSYIRPYFNRIVNSIILKG